MENRDYRDLGKLFGEYALWGNKYLPRSGEESKDSVLGELLQYSQETRYQHISSLKSYCIDYARFSEAYHHSLADQRSVQAEPPYACVPYWGSEFWKPKPSLRLAVFAQRSLNVNGASIPLYFPLCDIDDCIEAFEVGVNLGKKQPGKEKPRKKQPDKMRRTGLFGWQSFMSVWIAMRFLFSENEDKLRSVYYSDLEKITPKDDNRGLSRKEIDTRNRKLLAEEIKIIDPGLVLIFGKTGHRKYEDIFKEAGVSHRLYICFPCGNGARPENDLNAETLYDCRGELRKYFHECRSG